MKLKFNLRFIFVGVFLLSSCAPSRVFYLPNRVLYNDPDKWQLKCEVVYFPSQNGKKIYGLYIPCDGDPKGVVVHLHGNFGNVSNHFPQALFLTKRGWDVLTVDYQGYGGSEGKPSPKRTIEDGVSAVLYARDLPRNKNKVVMLFGQSLGASVGAGVAAMSPFVKAVVLEAGFTSYREMARVVIKKNFILWLAYPIYPFLLPTAYDPVKYVKQIFPRPVLFIHGDRDHIVPVEMSKRLYQAAAEPKELWIVEGADHLEIRKKGQQAYENRIGDFFDKALLK